MKRMPLDPVNLRPALAVAATIAVAAACGAPSHAPAANDAPAANGAPLSTTPSAPASAIDPSSTAHAADPDSAAPEVAGPGGGPSRLTSRAVPLPGAEAPAFMDYVVYERANARVWVPVGNTGSVDLFDVASDRFTRVDGFKTAERELHGKKRTLGPSAVTIGDGVAYIGNRASSEVCPVDVKTLKTSACIKVASQTDGVAYVAPTREVWVTTPQDRSLTILDASRPDALKAKATLKTDGEPEGYAVDDAHGLFFTNLEDKGATLVVDVKTRKVKSTWNPGCGADGPRGLAFDAAHDFPDRGVHGSRSGPRRGARRGDARQARNGSGPRQHRRRGRRGLRGIRQGRAPHGRQDRREGPARRRRRGGHRRRSTKRRRRRAGRVYVPDSHGARLLVFGANR